jgi:multidrug resistance efflux pump
MDPLPTIPTPVALRWREFRIRVLPLLVFAIVVAGVVMVWRNAGISSFLSGVAEGVRSTVTSPQVGVLQQLNVHPYQVVRAGDPIAVVLPRDPRVALDLLQSDLAISRLRLQPTVAEQNAMNYEQIRVDLLGTKSELAIAKVNLERLENEVRRNTPLYKEKLVSEDIYDLSVKTRDMFKAEIETKTRTVEEIEKRMQALSTFGVPNAPSSNDLAQTVITQLESLRDAAATNWGPIVVRAPISGMVTLVYRQQGENLVEGEPLITINSDWADRIVGYLRQPYVVDPQVGMSVLVTTREKKPRKFWAEISQIGAQLETITNSLAFVRVGALVDSGLPVVIDVPKGMKIRPGETVDLVLRARPVDAVLTPASPSINTSSMAEHAARPLIE